MWKSVLAMSVCLLVGCVAMQTDLRADDNVEPADRNANQDVRRILEWLHSLPKRQSNRILSGQYGWNDTEKTFEVTGKWPAIYEDHLWQKNSAWDEWPRAEAHRRLMKDYWDKGGLVSIHMPIPNPKNRSHQHDREISGEEFRQVFEDGSAVNGSFKQWLDRLALHLDWLQQQGVTVFIRPFHEMNGAWFWYGKRKTANFKNLFRYTVNYLIEQKGLHNLIIVYSPHRREGAARYYPGDTFVDVVGIDTYHDPPVAFRKQYSSLIRFGKPFALTEVGWRGRGKKPFYSRDAKAEIIDAMRSATPSAVWWCSWAGSHSPVNQKNCRELYHDPLVVTREEIDWKR